MGADEGSAIAGDDMPFGQSTSLTKQRPVDFAHGSFASAWATKKDAVQSDLKERGKDALSEEDVDVANADFALRHQDGADPTETMMMSMYMLGAMEYFDTIDLRDVHRIAIEIAMVGVNGISPKGKYSIKSLPDKEFGGYQLLAWYYVSWARAIPEKQKSLGLPFDKAYESALQMYNAKHGES